MSDDSACDKFRRWSVVKKNHKEMGSVEKKLNNSMLRSSFRRSKCSFISGHSEDEEGMTFKKL